LVSGEEIQCNWLVREMNPNHLAKDELLYELSVRGITSEGDTNSLRKLFQSVVTKALPIDVSLLEKSQVNEKLVSCRHWSRKPRERDYPV
jgi:hypothetical protein